MKGRNLVNLFCYIIIPYSFYFDSYSYDLTHSLQYNMTSVVCAHQIACTNINSQNSNNDDSSWRSSQNFLHNEMQQRRSSSRLDSLWEDESDQSFLEQSLSNDVQLSNEFKDIAISDIVNLPDVPLSFMPGPVKGEKERGMWNCLFICFYSKQLFSSVLPSTSMLFQYG